MTYNATAETPGVFIVFINPLELAVLCFGNLNKMGPSLSFGLQSISFQLIIDVPEWMLLRHVMLLAGLRARITTWARGRESKG